MRLIRAALYARYSSEMQNERSIEDQIAICQQHAEREGYEIAKVYADRAKTGASLVDRDGLLSILRDAKEGRFDVLIVESLDRISRDQADLAYIHKRLIFAKVRILTLNEGEATSTHVSIRGLIGSLFLKDLGDKVRRSRFGMVKAGRLPGVVPYGYRLVPGKPGEREIVPEEAVILQRIFTQYAEGRSPGLIADDLNREGVPFKGGRPWRAGLIGGDRNCFMATTLYTGVYHYNRSHGVRNPETGKPTTRPNRPEDVIKVELPHLRIISDELWAACHKVKKARGLERTHGGPAPTRKETLLSGLLQCGVCGGPMILGAGGMPGRPRLKCKETTYHTGRCTHTKTYDLAKVEEAAVAGLRVQLANPEALAAYVDEYRKERQRLERQARKDRDGIRKKLSEIEGSIMRLVDALERGSMPEDIITARLKALEAERVALKDRDALAEQDTNIVDMHPQAIERFRAAVDRLDRDMAENTTPDDEDRRTLRHMLERVDVMPTKKRAPVEVAFHGRLMALLGVDGPVPRRTVEQIVAEEGTAIAMGEAARTYRLDYSNRTPVFLGTYRAAA